MKTIRYLAAALIMTGVANASDICQKPEVQRDPDTWMITNVLLNGTAVANAEWEEILSTFCGIGIMISTNNGVTVERAIPDSPAKAAGLMSGDKIISVDNEPTEGKTLANIAQKIRGDAGTTVTLRIKRNSQETDYVIERSAIRLDPPENIETEDVEHAPPEGRGEAPRP
jgi:predicted metalloprotease with PDZ domain